MRKYFLILSAALFPILTAAHAWSGPGDDLFNHSSKIISATVAKVITADTIVLDDDKKIRLIGLDAPAPPKFKRVEYDKNGFPINDATPVETIEEKALNFTRNLLENKKIRLEYDADQRNENFQTLAYVFTASKGKEIFANEEIIRQGFANLKIAPPNTKYAEKLRQAYQEARKEKRGLQGE